MNPRVLLARTARAVLTDRAYVRLRNAYRRRLGGERPYCAACEAPIAGFTANRFGELVCPQCGAFPRTRAAMLYLRPRLANSRGLKVLNFAPHPAKEKQLAAFPGVTYVTADHPYASTLYGSRCMLPMDLERLPCADDAFDFIVAISVVQFVLRDAPMFREVFRVLAPGGRFVFETTIFGDATVEHYSAEELAALEYGERDRLDGLLMTSKWSVDGKLRHDPRQYVRQYGLDVADRARSAGLDVSMIRFDALCASSGRTPVACGLAQSADHLLFVCDKPAFNGQARSV